MPHTKRERFSRKAFLATALLTSVSLLPLAQAEPPPVEVTAKLVEIPSKMPPDDLYDYAYVMRYQVQGGPLAGEEVGRAVIHDVEPAIAAEPGEQALDDPPDPVRQVSDPDRRHRR